MLYSQFLKLTLLIVLVLLIISASAQVTIGSSIVPNKGALLDLKQFEPSTNNASAAKGILLPRVKLTKVTSLSDVVSDSPITSETNTGHMGMLVYNVNEKGILCQDVYTWNGSQWIPMMPKVETITDLEGNIYPIRKFGAAGYWMIQNLRSTYNNVIPEGTIVERLSTNADNANRVYYYPLNQAEYEINPEYGLIYTWAAATNNIANDQFTSGAGTKTSTVQGICPEGWVLPSDYDWGQLEKEIATFPELYSTNSGTSWSESYNTVSGSFRPAAPANGHGKSMKSTMNVLGVPNATNGLSNPICKDVLAAGFNGHLTGQNTSFYGTLGYYWSSSAGNATTTGWFRAISAANDGVVRGTLARYFSVAVRCKKAAI